MALEKIVYWQARCDGCDEPFPFGTTDDPLHSEKKELLERLKKGKYKIGKKILCQSCQKER